MSSADNYWLVRAEEEIERAQRSNHPKAVSAHFRLAELYIDNVYGTNDPPAYQRQPNPA